MGFEKCTNSIGGLGITPEEPILLPKEKMPGKLKKSIESTARYVIGTRNNIRVFMDLPIKKLQSVNLNNGITRTM